MLVMLTSIIRVSRTHINFMTRGAFMDHRQLPREGNDGPPAESAVLVPTRLGRLHVRVIGDGTTTVLWPSMFVDSHTFDPMVALLPSGRRYVLVDPPGLGLSQALREVSDINGAAEAATDLLAGLAEVDGIDAHGPVDWVGNAFGGHVGFKLAARPGLLRSLVAVSSPTQPLPASLRRQINLLLPILRAAGPVGPVRSAVVSAMLTDAAADREPVRRGRRGLAGPSHRPQHGPGGPVVHPEPRRRHRGARRPHRP